MKENIKYKKKWNASWITCKEFYKCEPLNILHKKNLPADDTIQPVNCQNLHMLVRKEFYLRNR